jgi:hypothetical protein
VPLPGAAFIVTTRRTDIAALRFSGGNTRR